MSTNSNTESMILHDKVGQVAIITLNRPKALNALVPSMTHDINHALESWKNSANPPLVFIMKGAGDKAFCAGGDVKAVWEDCNTIMDNIGLGTGESGRLSSDFFHDEYIMNYNLGTSIIPQISLWDGVVMGGGVGVSIFGEYRIATEKTLFAMPETAIGLFPDVGSSAWLPHIGDGMGEYLALTGFRLKARDLIALGIATHYLDSNTLLKFEYELTTILNEHSPSDIRGIIDLLLMELMDESESLDMTSAFSNDEAYGRARISACFDKKNSIEEIFICLNSLAQAGKPADVEWANQTLKALSKCSPTSLKLTLAQIQRGRSLNLKECLEMEYRLAQGCMRGNDFKEGVRALLVDKDKNPHWNPADLIEVDDDMIESHFNSLQRELVLNNETTGLMGPSNRRIINIEIE